MKAKTHEGKRLKRLADVYAKAYGKTEWLGSMEAEDARKVWNNYQAARKKLFNAIDELTSVDLTPRDVHDNH